MNGSIKTERLILCPLAPGDVLPRYVSWLNDPKINRFLEIRFVPQTIESVRQFINDVNRDPANLFYGIFTKDTESHIGNIKLGPINTHHRRADIGIVIGEKKYWGKGIATEAISAISDHAFNVLGLHKINAGFYSENTASGRAFLKAGFYEEARLREHWLSDGQWQDQIILTSIRPGDK